MDDSTTHAERTAPRLGGLVVGIARAGTRWMVEALHAHPSIAAFGETSFWGRRFVSPGPTGRYDPPSLARLATRMAGANLQSTPLQRSSGELLGEALDNVGEQPTPREVFDALVSAVGRAEGKELVVEKTPHHVNWLQRIRAAYPHVPVIVMVREPYGFMLSYKHQGERKGGPVGERFGARYHPAACAVVYRRSLKSALDALADAQTLRIEFDSLRTAPEETLADVQRFLGVTELPLAVRATNSSFTSGPRPTLDPIDVFWMNCLAGGTIRRAGYGLQKSSVGMGVVLCSLASLPSWFKAIRATRDLPLGYLARWFR